MDKEEFDKIMDELGIPKENINTVYACPFCNSDEPIESSEGDFMICFPENPDDKDNLLVNFNTFKHEDTQDLYSITAGFKINYCPVCGRDLTK